MLFYKNPNSHSFWIYYIEKINIEGNEEYVFKKETDGSPWVKNIQKEECYFLKIEDNKEIYDVLKFPDGTIMLDRFNVELNWSIYLFKDILIAMPSNIYLELLKY